MPYPFTYPFAYDVADSWLEGWDNRVKLTIDHTKVDRALSHFPVLVHLSSSCGLGSDDMTRVFDELGANSLKLAVTDKYGVELYVEIEKWDDTAEEAWLWVSKSGWSISATEDTVLYLYYDADHADNSTCVGVVGSAAGQAVWDSNFKLVDHMQDDPDTSHTKDSTSNGNDGTKKGAAEPAEATGKVGEAQDFDGSDDVIEANSVASDGLFDGAHTMEVIVKLDAWGNMTVMAGSRTDAVNYFSVLQFHSSYKFRVQTYTAAGGANAVYSTTTYNNDTDLHYLAAAIDADGYILRFIIDGVDQGSDSTYINDLSTVDKYYIGQLPWTSPNISVLNGIADESRVSNTARSAAWLLATKHTCWDSLLTFSVEALTVPDVRVRVAFDSDPLDTDPVWTDISGDVREVHPNRGRNHELGRMEAGTAAIVLTNLLGHYWPDNTSGDHYPNIKVIKRLNIRAVWDGAIRHVYTGYITSWTPGWLGEGGYGSIMTLNCVDAQKLIALQVLNDGSGYSAEASGTRIGNVLDDISWPAGDRDIDTGQETMQATGALANENSLGHLQSVQESELGLLFLARNGDVLFEDRSHRTKSPHDTSQATFGGGAGEYPYAEIRYVLDDARLFNEVRLTRTGGSEQVVTNSGSQDTYGKRSLVRSGLLLNTDDVTWMQATFMASRYADVVGRVESIKLLPSPTNNLWPQVLTREISDRVTIKKAEASLDREYFIERVQHDWNLVNYTFATAYQVSDAAQYLYTPDAFDTTLVADSNVVSEWNDGDYTRVDVDDANYSTDTTKGGVPLEEAVGFDNWPYSTGVINSVTIKIKIKQQTGSGGQFNWGARYSGSDDWQGQQALPGSKTEYTKVYTVSPFSGVAWTPAEITGLAINVKYLDPGAVWNSSPGWYFATVIVNMTPSW